jgi:hypothetical protein
MAGAMSLRLAKVVTKVLLGGKAVAIDVGSDGRSAFVRHVDLNSHWPAAATKAGITWIG